MSLREFTIKPPKPKSSAVQIQQQQQRKIQRIDVAPSNGYALVVGGHFKAQYEVEAAARKAAADLLGLAITPVSLTTRAPNLAQFTKNLI